MLPGAPRKADFVVPELPLCPPQAPKVSIAGYLCKERFAQDGRVPSLPLYPTQAPNVLSAGYLCKERFLHKVVD